MIQGKELRDALISASNCLSNEKKSVDELNVFPVPDGDTGTNMSMTMSAARRELVRLSDDTPIGEVASKASSALLRGARGNSGVILSLLFRGFAKGLKNKKEAGAKDIVSALKFGVDAAYKAVMKPTEGTMLTVAREAGEVGNKAMRKDISATEVWDVICKEAEESLERTPELLPVLKKAGVVDAGGEGLRIIFFAMKDIFEGGSIVDCVDEADKEQIMQAPKQHKTDLNIDIKFPYCTEFVVLRDKSVTENPIRLRAYLESIGDSVVVVDDDEIIKVHAHTIDPGKAISAGLKYGQFENIKVDNMRIQHSQSSWVSDDEVQHPDIPERAEPEKEFGFVAVSAGEGLHDLFKDLGVDVVVSGGQTMNPSTDDILHAIEATPAKHVIVLPNNKNIILSAEQTVPLADRKVSVLQTRTIPQGISSLLAFDESVDIEENLLNMMKMGDNVSTGSVTFAARDSDFDGKKIKEGEILAIDDGKVAFSDNDIYNATVRLAKNIMNSRKAKNKETSFLTIIYGEAITETEANAVKEGIAEKVGKGFDITLVNGGQPIYYYLISAE